MNENQRLFIIELTALSRKYRVGIGGCGCCGSPYLTDLKPEDLPKEAGYTQDDGDSLTWIKPGDFYWEKGCSKIVR